MASTALLVCPVNGCRRPMRATLVVCERCGADLPRELVLKGARVVGAYVRAGTAGGAILETARAELEELKLEAIAAVEELHGTTERQLGLGLEA